MILKQTKVKVDTTLVGGPPISNYMQLSWTKQATVSTRSGILAQIPLLSLTWPRFRRWHQRHAGRAQRLHVCDSSRRNFVSR